jgi:hypothetical protein
VRAQRGAGGRYRVERLTNKHPETLKPCASKYGVRRCHP